MLISITWYRTGLATVGEHAHAQVNVGLIEYIGPGAPLLPLAERQAHKMRQQAAEVCCHNDPLFCELASRCFLLVFFDVLQL